MKYFKYLLYFILSLSLMLVISACQNEQAHKHQVKTLLNSALEYIQENGKQTAIAEFNKTDGLFSNGYLYVFAYNYKGVCLANGGNPKLAGRNLYNLKDNHGKFIIQDLIKVAKTGGGWSRYYWADPATKKVEEKFSYVLPVNKNYFISAGYYLDHKQK